MPRMMELVTPLGDDVLLFHGMRAREEMSRLFEYQLDLLSLNNDINVDEILGKNVTVKVALPDDTTRYFNGFVTRFAQGGKGEQIRWCSAQSPFGWMVVGSTDRGLCWLSLGSTREEAEDSLRAEFPAAELRRDPSLSELVEAALASVREGSDLNKQGSLGGGLDLRGTVFQLRVWQALRQIPRGETRSYSELAREMGEPNATRAVARACATNRVALIVPCHRVVGADGSLTGYRWGVERKRELLEAERG